MSLRSDPGAMRTYKREWIAKRRAAWIKENGPCRKCGSLSSLEVDHIDPIQKRFHVREIWSRCEEFREAELSKCQVLCKGCHWEKTQAECYRPRVHGTVPMYKGGKCRCPLCREANSRYNKNHRRNAALIFVRPSDLRRAF